MIELHDRLTQCYVELWNDQPQIMLRANGRANIIGEHTDYHLGYVFPFAINKGIVFAASVAEELAIFSLDYQEKLTEFSSVKKGSWQSYISNALNKLSELANIPIKLKLVFGGDLPIGAGLSSSSALCCGVIELVDRLYDLKLDNIKKVNLASEIEHGAGVQGGKMDQYTIFFGKENHAILMDCQSLTNEPAVIPSTWKFILINTLVKHNLVHTQYNTRRSEGELGLDIINGKYPHIRVGRDLTSPILEECSTHLTTIQFNRLRHVVTENDRVLGFLKAMSNSDIDTCGHLLNESHRSLRDLYEVSCEELDYLQKLAYDTSFIYGARMMGGGFGGCTINLINDIDADQLEIIMKKFQEKYNYLPEVYEVSPSNGMTWL